MIGALVAAPWPHLEFEQFLDPDHAARIAADWPTDGWQYLKHSDAVLPNGTSKRRWQPLAERFPDVADDVLWMERSLRAALRVEGELHQCAILVEDAPDYWIRKHTDCNGKVISAQVYFPDPGAPETQGVVLEPDHQIPYRMNYGYAFKVSSHSWHRVRRAPLRRRSLQVIYYDRPQP